MRKFQVFSASALSAALAVSLLAAPAVAQDMDEAVAAAQNQLGLLEFCEAGGHIDGTAAETQKKLMAMLPAATDTAKVEEAYAKGKEGKLSISGVEQDLTELAEQEGALATMCTQMADALAAAAAQVGG